MRRMSACEAEQTINNLSGICAILEAYSVMYIST